MKAVGAPRSYVERATDPPYSARGAGQHGLVVAGKHAGVVTPFMPPHVDRGLSVRYAASDLHAHDVGTMLSSGPS